MPFWNRFCQKTADNSDSAQPRKQADLALFSTTGEYGLKTLAEGDQDKVDIVFFHGLTGNRESTWTYQNTTAIFWPRDLLPNDLPNVRIFTFGYDADVVKILSTVGTNTVRDHGNSLAQDLAMRRTRTNSSTRPLIFVAHSLGGLVVEQALLIARGSSQPHVKLLLPSTVAIAFMGTPHAGSPKADLASPLTALSNLVRKTNKSIVAVLEPGSEMLANLQQEFHTMLEDRRRNEGKWMDIFCFYEEIPYPGIGDIVPRNSAILPVYPNASIHSNHSDMTKFTGKKDAGYIRVRDQLELWVEAAAKQATMAQTTDVNQDRESNAKDESRGTRSNVQSGGGAIFMGNVTAGRDFRYNQR